MLWLDHLNYFRKNEYRTFSGAGGGRGVEKTEESLFMETQSNDRSFEGIPHFS